MDIHKWSRVEGDNDALPPAGAPEGWTGKDINDWARETMRAVAQWYRDPQWIYPLYETAVVGNKTVTPSPPNSFTIVGADLSTELGAGRKIRMIDAGTVETPSSWADDYVVSAVPSAGDTVVTVANGNVPATIVTNGVGMLLNDQISELGLGRESSVVVQLANTIALQAANAAASAFIDLIQANASDEVEVGDATAVLRLLGSVARPTYNGGDLALFADLASVDAITLGGEVPADHMRWISGDYVESGSIAIPSAAGVVSAAHGFNPSIPRLVHGFLRCISIDNGYSVGQLVPIGFDGGSQTTRNVSYYYDDTKVYCTFGASGIYMTPAGGGTTVVFDRAKWEFEFHAWK